MTEQHRLAAILFADVVGFGALAQRDEAQALALMRRCREALDDATTRRGGRLVKTIGDGFLMEFGSAVRALDAALAMHAAMRELAAGTADGASLRIGLHVGEVAVDHGDLLGDNASLVPRIAPQAEPGGVCMTDAFHAQVRGRTPLKLASIGRPALRNVREPPGLFEVVWTEGAGAAAATTALERAWYALRRRNVVPWTLGYLAAAWVAIQVLALVAEQFGWPPPLARAATVALAFGALPAIVIAWYHGEGGVQRVTAREAALVAASLVVCLGAAWRAADGGAPARDAALTARLPIDSIAVLPFDELDVPSAGKDGFAEGFHDELITRLARLDALRVISRTSVLPYRGRTDNVKRIAEELGVGAILEGSLRRDGNRIRLNVQLIDARNDAHLWADTFNRDLTDAFAVQEELAIAVARELKVALTAAERSSAAGGSAPPSNPQAYVRLLEATNTLREKPAQETHRERLGRLRSAQRMLHEAIVLDPQSGLAHARLAEALILDSYQQRSSAAKEHMDLLDDSVEAAASRAVDDALRLQPDLPEAHFVRGLYLFRVALPPRFDEAREHLALALAGIPNDAEYLAAAAELADSTARHGEAIELLERAVDRSPGERWLWDKLIAQLMAHCRYGAARARLADPRLPPARDARLQQQVEALLAYHALAQPAPLRAWLEPAAPLGFDERSDPLKRRERFELALMIGAFDVAAAQVADPDEEFNALPAALYRARLAAAQGKTDDARALYAQAIPLIERQVRVAAYPYFLAPLGESYCAVGRLDEGLVMFDAAAAKAREVGVQRHVAGTRALRVQCLLRSSRERQALRELSAAVGAPYSFSYGTLALDPAYAKLREQPGWPALLAFAQASAEMALDSGERP